MKAEPQISGFFSKLLGYFFLLLLFARPASRDGCPWCVPKTVDLCPDAVMPHEPFDATAARRMPLGALGL